MIGVRISRRQLLRGTATVLGAAAVGHAVPAWALSGGRAVPMRSIGTASGSDLAPSIAPLAGLAGFDDLLQRTGAAPAFRWTGLPPAPGEATFLLSGFSPNHVSLRHMGLVIEGARDPTAVRMLGLGLGRRPAPPDVVVEVLRTPEGVPYEEAFLPAKAPDVTMPVSLVESAGRRLTTVMVPILATG